MAKSLKQEIPSSTQPALQVAAERAIRYTNKSLTAEFRQRQAMSKNWQGSMSLFPNTLAIRKM